MSGRTISFPADGKKVPGYLSPAATAPGPGVVVIQEWWGLVPHIQNVCDRFAAEGFSALAPDLYGGKSTSSPDDAGRMFMALHIGETEKVMRGAIEALLADPSCSSKTVGIVGYCMGGQLALYAAATNPETVSACVDYYGVHPNAHPPLDRLKAPLLGFFAEHDGHVTPEVVGKLDEELRRLGKPHEFHRYPGTKHGFFNDERPQQHDAAASKDTWRRTLAFFREHVR